MKHLFISLLSLLFIISCQNDQEINDTNSSINGSYSHMITVGDFIYAIDKESITTLDITDPKNPIQINIQTVGFTIESIFHHTGNLFVGGEEGLTIYHINSNGIPIKQSQTAYFVNESITSCDPVVARGDYAYVTLSADIIISNGRCSRAISTNELRIFDISDINKPVHVSTTPLSQPKGLSLDGDYLFVCEKETGFSVINISDPINPSIKTTFTDFESYDLIASNGLLMVVCPTEIRQYDYTDIDNIKFLSGIEL